MKTKGPSVWIARLFVIVMIACSLWCCTENENEATIKSITILNTESPLLIDRGEKKEVLFEVTPSDIVLSRDMVSLNSGESDMNFRFTGIDQRARGVYCAYVEDLDYGIPYNKEISFLIQHVGPDNSVDNCESNSISLAYIPSEYGLSEISNVPIYDNNNHSAFTGIINYKGSLYLAFREGTAHRPSTVTDYGAIRVMRNDGLGWTTSGIIRDKTKDLRDPFLVEMDGSLRMYIGYNTFEGERYQHSGSVYADYDGTNWSGIKTLSHDVPHIVWLWKVRKYADKYYSVAYLEGEFPAFLSSSDGINWETVTLFEFEGELSEADMCFIGKTIYVCLRKDKPVGTPSLWGVSQYPFNEFKWTQMTTCIESPELLRLPYSNSLYLACRERQPSTGEVSVSLFSASMSGELKKIATFDSGIGGDKGYPGLTVKDGFLYCSYYTGLSTGTSVKMATLGIDKKQ